MEYMNNFIFYNSIGFVFSAGMFTSLEFISNPSNFRRNMKQHIDTIKFWTIDKVVSIYSLYKNMFPTIEVNKAEEIDGLIYNKNGERTKLRNSTYEKIKHLKGNSPKLQYQYYHLRQQGGVKDFLKYYPEYKEEFSEFRTNLHKWTNQLYQNYISCFIRKEKALIDFPYNFKTHMYKIHEIYLNDLKPENKYVNKYVIVNYVNTLPPPRLMYSVNHNKKNFEKERRIVTSDLKVLMKSEV